MFNALEPRPTAADDCTDAIRRAILTGALGPGERLPPERQLAETFGVNRVTVRSALTRLAVAGLLSVRQGSGYVVLDYHATGGPDLLPGLAELAETTADRLTLLGDLLLVRRHLARAVLERLVDHDDDATRRAVTAAIEDFAEIAGREGAGLDELARADLAVLAALLTATGSDVLQLCFNPVLQLVTRLGELRAAMYAEPQANVLGYRVLARWLESPDRAAIETVAGLLARRDEATLARVRSALAAGLTPIRAREES